LAPLFISNILINAAMAYFGIGVNINTLPLVTVGVGFGIDYGLYILSRIIEEIRVNGDLDLSIREALVTSGKAVSFTAFCMAGGRCGARALRALRSNARTAPPCAPDPVARARQSRARLRLRLRAAAGPGRSTRASRPPALAPLCRRLLRINNEPA